MTYQRYDYVVLRIVLVRRLGNINYLCYHWFGASAAFEKKEHATREDCFMCYAINLPIYRGPA